MENQAKFKTEAEYFSDTEFISNSMMRDWRLCPHYFQLKHIEKNYQDPYRDYFIFGSAVDKIITEPEKFDEQFVKVERTVDVSSLEELKKEAGGTEFELKMIKEENEKAEKKTDIRPTKALENKIESLKEKISAIEIVGNKYQLTPAVHQGAIDCRDELLRQPLFKKFGFLEKGTTQEIIAITTQEGYKVKGKIDFLNLDRKIIADLKTTANIETFKPENYFGQMAWYQWLVEQLYGIHCEVYLTVVDKQTENKRSQIYLIPDNYLGLAQNENLETLKLLSGQIKSGFFTPISGIHDNRFSCPAYRSCPYALQNEVVIVK